jgi:hypothetical protein
MYSIIKIQLYFTRPWLDLIAFCPTNLRLSLSISLTIPVILAILLSLAPLNSVHLIWIQQEAFDQEQSENISNQTANRLDTIIELLEQSRQGSIIQLNLTIIVFMMGLAFVIFGLYIGQEHKLSAFTRRLYLIAYFALIVPITVIIVRYIASALSSGALNDPVLTVALLLLIPVTASYVLMIVKSRHDILGHS